MFLKVNSVLSFKINQSWNKVRSVRLPPAFCLLSCESHLSLFFALALVPRKLRNPTPFQFKHRSSPRRHRALVAFFFVPFLCYCFFMLFLKPFFFPAGNFFTEIDHSKKVKELWIIEKLCILHNVKEFWIIEKLCILYNVKELWIIEKLCILYWWIVLRAV